MKADYLYLTETESLQQKLDIAIERVRFYQSKIDKKYSNHLKYWRKQVEFYLSIDPKLKIGL